MADSTESPTSKKRKRRTLTDEQRIAEREAEIEAIKAKRRERISQKIYDLALQLDDLCDEAAAADMGQADLCRAAAEALKGGSK